MSAFGQSPGPVGREQANRELMALYAELLLQNPSAAQSLWQYIQSGWTTNVDPAIAPQVSSIVGRPVGGGPAGTGGATGDYQRTSPPAAQGGFQDTRANIQASQPDQPVPDPFAAPPPIRPVSTGLVGGAASAGLFGSAVPGLPPAGSGGPLPAGPGPSLPVNDPQNPYNPGNAAASPSTIAGAAQQGTRAGHQAVRDAVPTTTPPTTTPGGAPVKPLDPNSAVGQGGYGAAMRGDKSALNAVLGKLLGGLGVDVTHPGWYTADIVDQVQPYLETFLRYYGLDNGAPAFDRAREAAGQFGNLIGGAGTFGKLQEYGRSLVPGINDFLTSGVDPSRQAGVVNDLAMLLGAGQNQLRQAATQQRLQASAYNSQVAGLDSPNQNYLDFLRQDAQANPQGGYGDLLRVLLGGR